MEMICKHLEKEILGFGFVQMTSAVKEEKVDESR